MGRQTNFHARTTDFESLPAFLSIDGNTCISARHSEEQAVLPLLDFASVDLQKLFLWRRDLSETLNREWVPEQQHFAIDFLHLTVIELSVSFECEFEDSMRLGSGESTHSLTHILKSHPHFQSGIEGFRAGSSTIGVRARLDSEVSMHRTLMTSTSL